MTTALPCVPRPPTAAEVDATFALLRAQLIALDAERTSPFALSFLAALQRQAQALATAADPRSPATPQGRADDEAPPASGVA